MTQQLPQTCSYMYVCVCVWARARLWGGGRELQANIMTPVLPADTIVIFFRTVEFAEFFSRAWRLVPLGSLQHVGI
jgi:hypothetical protein